MKPFLSFLLLTAVAACSGYEPVLLPLPKVSHFTGRWVEASEPVITIVDSIPGTGRSKEAYCLEIGREAIEIEAVSQDGVWNARQTLAQLLQDGKYPVGKIKDWPAFPIRGWMMDCGRTYVSMEELRREIDNLSSFKINTFHWHLTDNEAYRLQSLCHPEINGNMTRQPGLFYTQEEARELVVYCRERGITLIPEIDVPGHSAYFDRIYGFGMQTPEGKGIMKELLEEACDVFEGCPWFHIGTDEVRFEDPSFVPEMVALLRSRGKKVISWNPGWHFEPGEIDMTQLWSYRGKAQEGIPAIDCRLHYINHFDLYGDIVGLHTSSLCGEGSIIAVWNDRFITPEEQIPLQNNLYASALALADRAWRGGGYQYFDSFGVCLPESGPAYDDFSSFETRMCTLAGDLVYPYRPQSGVRWQISEPFPNEGDLSKAFAPETGGYDWSRAGTAVGSGIYLRHVWGPSIVKGYFEDPQPWSTVYARRIIKTDMERDAILWFETQNHSRSEHDLPAPEGEWDYRKSRIWLNGEAVSVSPLRVHLHKGDNEILVKLPVGEFSTPETRLVKWMFTCSIDLFP